MGIYEMHGAGLKGVKNPSEIWLAQREEVLSGIGIAAVLEGVRPLLLETQALVSTAVYGTPQRSAAAPTSMARALAPACLATIQRSCTVDEPPVIMNPPSRISLSIS